MMARFYGWTDQQLESLTALDFEDYWKAIEVIEARESMIHIESATYPHLDKKEDRRRMWSAKKRTFSNGFEKPRGEILTYQQVAENLARKLQGG